MATQQTYRPTLQPMACIPLRLVLFGILVFGDGYVDGSMCGISAALSQTTLAQAPKQPAPRKQNAPKPAPQAIHTESPSRKLAPVPLADYAVGALPDFLSGASVWLPTNVAAEPLTYVHGKLVTTLNEPGFYLFAFSWENEDDLSGYWERDLNDFRSLLRMNFEPLFALDLNWPPREKATRYYILGREFPPNVRLDLRTRRSMPPPIIRLAAGVPLPPLEQLEIDASWPEKLHAESLGIRMQALLRAEKYDALEKWTAQLMQGGDRFPSGLDKLRALNQGFDMSYARFRNREDMALLVERAEAWRKQSPESRPALTAAVRSLSARAAHLEINNWPEPEIVESSRRRALELAYDYGKAHPDSPLPLDLTLELARSSVWTLDMTDEFVQQLLQAKTWRPEALVDAFYRYSAGGPLSNVPQKEIDSNYARYFANLKQHADPRDFDALYAWVLGEVNWVRYQVELDYTTDIAAAKRGFDALLTRFPQPRRRREQYCKFACLTGDRTTAARLFRELGPFAARENGVFDGDGVLASYRAWADEHCLDGEQSALFESTNDEPLSVRWSRDGKNLLVGDARGVLWSLDAKTARREKYNKTFSGPVTRSPAAISITADGERFLTGGRSGMTGMARAEDRTEPRMWVFGNYLPQISAVGMSDDRTWLVSATAPQRMMNVSSANQPWGEEGKGFGMPVPGGAKSFLGFLAENDRFVTADWLGEVRLWKILSDKVESTETRQAHNAPGYCCGTLTKDKAKLATYGGDHTLRVWKVDSGDLLNEFDQLPRPIFAMQFSPNGRFLAIGEGTGSVGTANVVIYDLDAKRAIKTFVGHKASVSGIDFSTDGRTLVTSGLDMTIRLWDLTPLWR